LALTFPKYSRQKQRAALSKSTPNQYMPRPEEYASLTEASETCPMGILQRHYINA